MDFDLNMYKKMIYHTQDEEKNENNTTPFYSFDEIYFKTNENLHEYEIDSLKDKKVLTVTSSADHALYAILKGATNIYSFDINRFTKLYSNLKVSMIKALEYQDFITTLMKLKNDNKEDNVFERYIIDKVKNYLSYDEILFWIECDKYFSAIKLPDNFSGAVNKSLFIYDDCDFRYTPYNNSNNYYKLKQNIFDANIKYLDSDIDSLSKKVKNEKFDNIFLSNIMSYVFDKEKFNCILKDMHDILNDYGIIYMFDLIKNATFNNLYDFKNKNDLFNMTNKHTKNEGNLYILKNK